jgi:hypothetical protein
MSLKLLMILGKKSGRGATQFELLCKASAVQVHIPFPTSRAIQFAACDGLSDGAALF